MKTLSLIFLIIGMLFLALGMCILLINFNSIQFFTCIGFGCLSISIFILIENLLLKYGKK